MRSTSYVSMIRRRSEPGSGPDSFVQKSAAVGRRMVSGSQISDIQYHCLAHHYRWVWLVLMLAAVRLWLCPARLGSTGLLWVFELDWQSVTG
jgi:hypothetical protein